MSARHCSTGLGRVLQDRSLPTLWIPVGSRYDLGPRGPSDRGSPPQPTGSPPQPSPPPQVLGWILVIAILSPLLGGLIVITHAAPLA